MIVAIIIESAKNEIAAGSCGIIAARPS